MPSPREEDYIESLGRRQHPTFRAAGSLLAADVVRGGLLRTEAVLAARPRAGRGFGTDAVISMTTAGSICGDGFPKSPVPSCTHSS